MVSDFSLLKGLFDTSKRLSQWDYTSTRIRGWFSVLTVIAIGQGAKTLEDQQQGSAPFSVTIWYPGQRSDSLLLKNIHLAISFALLSPIYQYSLTVLHCDNLSAVYHSANPTLHNRSNHFDTDFHYIREQVALGLIETQHIPAKDQFADIFTKPLARRPFAELRGKFGATEPPTPSLRAAVSNPTTISYQPKAKDPVTKPTCSNAVKTRDKVKTRIFSPSVPTRAVSGLILRNAFTLLQSVITG